MSIHDFPNKIKGIGVSARSWTEKYRNTLILGLILVGSSGISFAIGFSARAYIAQAAPVVIECPASAYMPAPAVSAAVPAQSGVGYVTGAYVASKNGKKYYPASCSVVSNIKQENRVYFATEAAAIAAGYSLSATCT